MFMVSVKLSRKRLLVGLAALALVIGVGVAGVRIMNQDAGASATLTDDASDSDKVKVQKVTLKTAADRVAYVQSFGWETNPEPVEVLEVIVPEEFDQVYTDYNTIQKKQGFNLEKYAGKRAKRYSYVITNYPGVQGEVRFNLLLHGDKVIGGDVSSLDQNGFMHGFLPQA